MIRRVLALLALVSIAGCTTVKPASIAVSTHPACACMPMNVAPTYIVFFDWKSSNLPRKSKQIIARAASAGRIDRSTLFIVSGFTDSSGSSVLNQALSIRRAKAVAVELESDGVQPSKIRISGYGATRLLVPTGPNIRYQVNRNVEIELE